ncbi:MAG: hypothetical protein KDA16_08575 [Phycisphaerales bacterium]|nr:hypothetical protein [Phycisphaerales bacterium]
MNRLNKTIVAASVVGISSAAFAGPMEEEHFDVWVQVESGQLTTGSFQEDIGGDIFTPDVRVFGVELGEISPNFADDPGFYANSMPAGFELGFNITDSLRVWNGSDFGTTASLDMTAWLAFGVMGSPSATTPATAGGSTAGFNFATADGTGFFDSHPDFVLNAPATDGIYLLQLELTGTGVLSSEPFWIVFNQNLDEETHDAAIDWANTNLVPTPGMLMAFIPSLLAVSHRKRG